jgi:hypothetical protein
MGGRKVGRGEGGGGVALFFGRGGDFFLSYNIKVQSRVHLDVPNS